MSRPDPELARRLPHRPPAVLVEALAEGSDGEPEVVFSVRADSYWVAGGRLTLAGMTEAMAQAAGALAAQPDAGEPGGVLVGLEELVVDSLPQVDETVHITCHTLRRLGPGLWVRAEARACGRRCAAGTVKLFLTRPEAP